MRRSRLAHAATSSLLTRAGRAAPTRSAPTLCALALTAGLTSIAVAQPSTQSQIAQSQIAQSQINGRDFAGTRLPIPTVTGSIRLHARKVHVWSEPGLSPADPSTRRLVLEDSVQITLGDAVFDARRAYVWMQNLQPVGAAGGQYQVFVVFEDVGSPAAAAGPSVAAVWLPVQGIIQTTDRPAMQADLVLQGRPPVAPGLRDAEIELANHLRRILGQPELLGARLVEADPRVWQPMAAPWIGRPVYATAPGATQAGAAASPVATVPGGAPGSPGIAAVPGTPTTPGVASPGDAPMPTIIAPIPGPRLISQAEAAAATTRIRDTIAALPAVDVPIARPPVQGMVIVSRLPDTIQEGQGEAGETVIMFNQGVVIQSTDAVTGRTLLLKADRAVVFHDPGPLADLFRFDQTRFRGVYLEGAVMGTDGQYTIRGNSVYYDLRVNRAIILDAVFNTYDERLGMPLYVRADAIRQEAQDEFTAENPRLSTSAFFRPMLTLGASSITLRRLPGSDGAMRNLVDADNINLRAGPIPFFYWPTFEGDPERFPLRAVQVNSPGGSDGAIKTTWDILSLTGIDGPKDLGAQLEANLLVDYYFQRGIAGGLDANWATDRGEGAIFAYGILDDEGEDRTHSGTKLGHDGDTRGLILAEHRYRFSDAWTFTGEIAYVGDPTFVDAFFDTDGETRREFATGLAAQRLESNTAVTIQARASLMDFSPNEYILAGPGYTTEKLPEFRYQRLSDDLLPDMAPGMFSSSLDARGGLVRMNFTDPTAAELGFTNPGRARAGLGIEPEESIGDRLRAEGYVEQGVWRGDMRHEIAGKFALGPVNLTPFAVGRATIYDNDFDEFSPEENDEVRLWGSLGATASTSIQRVDNSVESELFDLHRLRHIIEPSVTIFHSASTVDSADLPIYDDDVEGLSEGTSVRLALNQTFQTNRGPAGRSRSVDFLILDAEIIFNDDERDIESIISRWYDARPELTEPGTFGRVDALWQATESLGLTGQIIYNFDDSQPARTSAGYIIRHNPLLTSTGELRFLNAENVTYADFAAQYALTEKYSFTSSVSFDVDEGDLRRARLSLRREFPGVYVRVDYIFDNVQGESMFGFTVLPTGVPGLERGLD